MSITFNAKNHIPTQNSRTYIFWVLLYFELWKRIHAAPTFCIKAWQLYYLKKTFAEAYLHPVYRNIWKRADLLSRAIKTLDDIARFPILDKKTFRNFTAEDLVRPGFKGWYEWKKTSGTTGEPFLFPCSIFYRESFRHKFLMFNIFRPLYWARLDINKSKVAFIRINPHLDTSNHFIIYYADDICNTPSVVLDKLQIFKPAAIWGIPTLLTELAQSAKIIPENSVSRIPYAIVSSEKLLPAQRKFIEKTFQTELFECYGTEEMGNMAVECKFHHGMHIYEESFYVEIADEKGVSLPAGHTGRVVVTNFYNKVLPFIRYDTGDMGMIVPGLCPCGIPARRIIVDGRTTGFLSFKGRKIHFFELERVILQFSSLILRYQFSKKSDDETELRIIPTSNFDTKSSDELKRALESILNATVSIVPAKTLPITTRGKTSVFIDESRS